MRHPALPRLLRESAVKRKAMLSLRPSPHVLFLLTCLAAGPVHGGTCTNPTKNEGDIVYNGDFHTYQFCNGTNWIPYKAGSTWLYQAGNNPTYPAGSGFFVMSKSTW